MGSFSTQTDVNSQSAKEILNTEYIRAFDVVAKGTVNVGTSQYPNTGSIYPLKNLYRDYVLVMYNKSGVVLQSVTMLGINTNNIIPNQLVTDQIFEITGYGVSGGDVGNNTGTSLDLTRENINPFIIGSVKFQFNLATAPTSGTINWALIGY
jgi:hypothetical protein